MEDYILREIDRFGEMLLKIARRLGLVEGDTPDYTLTDVKEEFGRAGLPFDLDAILQQENPVLYLVDTLKISDQALETFIDILFHSDIDESKKAALLADALAWLDGKGSYSFRLHALASDVNASS